MGEKCAKILKTTKKSQKNLKKISKKIAKQPQKNARKYHIREKFPYTNQQIWRINTNYIEIYTCIK